jgi:hypothetical protein
MNDYIPVPRHVAMSDNPALVGHYNKLRALAWVSDYKSTGPISRHQLCAYMGLGKSRLLSVLADMEDRRWITKSASATGFDITFVAQDDMPSNKVDTSKKVDVVVKLSNQNINTINLTTASNKVDGVQLIGRELKRLGVHPIVASQIAQTGNPVQIMQAVEWYRWAKATGHAKSAGWLVRCIQETWEAPAEFVPPGWLCRECNRSKQVHATGCKYGYTLWADGGIDIEQTTCPTCGFQNPTHHPDCWRELFANELEGVDNVSAGTTFTHCP